MPGFSEKEFEKILYDHHTWSDIELLITNSLFDQLNKILNNNEEISLIKEEKKPIIYLIERVLPELTTPNELLTTRTKISLGAVYEFNTSFDENYKRGFSQKQDNSKRIGYGFLINYQTNDSLNLITALIRDLAPEINIYLQEETITGYDLTSECIIKNT